VTGNPDLGLGMGGARTVVVEANPITKAND
jgi:hypothetical protein